MNYSYSEGTPLVFLKIIFGAIIVFIIIYFFIILFNIISRSNINYFSSLSTIYNEKIKFSFRKMNKFISSKLDKLRNFLVNKYSDFSKKKFDKVVIKKDFLKKIDDFKLFVLKNFSKIKNFCIIEKLKNFFGKNSVNKNNN